MQTVREREEGGCCVSCITQREKNLFPPIHVRKGLLRIMSLCEVLIETNPFVLVSRSEESQQLRLSSYILLSLSLTHVHRFDAVRAMTSWQEFLPRLLPALPAAVVASFVPSFAVTSGVTVALFMACRRGDACQGEPRGDDPSPLFS